MGRYDMTSSSPFSSPAHSPTSTTTDTCTSSTQHSETPVYENIEELTRLCSNYSTVSSDFSPHRKIITPKMTPSMSDFLKSIPPPPPPIYDDVGFCDGKCLANTSSSVSSSASSRRNIIGNAETQTNGGGGGGKGGGGGGFAVDQMNSPPLPSSCSSTVPFHSRGGGGGFGGFDMRPLSMPHKEMQRIEREQSHRMLIITLLVITILIVAIALSIYIFFDQIESHINSISENF